jgi:Arc/MetJ family transcription regulator
MDNRLMLEPAILTHPVIPAVLPSRQMAKISISLDDKLYERIRLAAGNEGVSAWIAAMAAARLRKDVLHEVADEIAEETGGPFTEREMEEARKWLRSSSTPAR